MTKQKIEAIRKMLEDGMSVDDIANALQFIDAENAEAEDFERNAYGIDDHSRDDWTYAQVRDDDRRSMGQNDAGEWLGFM
tara:strand:- start:448 stop:687 length:240 start_codon:yes stop_codon:yes gene_type:complete